MIRELLPGRREFKPLTPIVLGLPCLFSDLDTCIHAGILALVCCPVSSLSYSIVSTDLPYETQSKLMYVDAPFRS